MSDHSKLKSLALEVPEGIVAPAAYDDDRSYSQSEVKLLNFLEAATPAAILALIAENERLAAILARQKSRRADDDECLSLATQSIDELRKDAERYRWLRRTEDWEYRSSPADHIVIGSHGGVINNTGEALDGAIDAAMGQGEQQ